MTRWCAGAPARLATLVTASAALALARVSAAAEPGARASPCVAVDASAGALDPSVRARFVEQIGAALAQHGMTACDAARGASGDAVADVAVESAGKNGVAIRIRVRDAVTRKDVARVVSLARTPADGRALAVALAADELLRASWAEIALAKSEAAASAVPPAPPEVAPIEPPREVRDVVTASLASARARLIAIDLAFAAEHATGGLDQAGVDLRALAWLFPRAAAAVRLGARVSPRVHASDGDADATGLRGGAGLTFALTPREGKVALEAPLRIDAERVQFSPLPIAGARGTNASSIAVIASTGLAASLRLGASFRLVGECTIGYALRPVEALDASASFAALSGAELGLSVALRALP